MEALEDEGEALKCDGNASKAKKEFNGDREASMCHRNSLKGCGKALKEIRHQRVLESR